MLASGEVAGVAWTILLSTGVEESSLEARINVAVEETLSVSNP